MTAEEQSTDPVADRYKWVVLANTTLGVLVVTINSSIVIISLPAIFRGIRLDPLQPANVSYLLWILLGFLVVTSVLVVSFGRLGDSLGRVRLYNLGFAIFTVCSVGLSLVFAHGSAAALAIIVLRVVQGVGGAMLFANSAAILTDAFPASQRGMALGVNSVAAVAGSFIGLVIGGLLASVDWHLVFLVSVPIGLVGTVWGYARLREVFTAPGGRMDWWGSVLFAVGLVAVLVGLTYGIQPYGGHAMGWTNPMVLGSVIGGVLILGIFVLVERRVAEPMLDFALLRNRTSASGNLASLLSSIGRGGLLFALIIWRKSRAAWTTRSCPTPWTRTASWCWSGGRTSRRWPRTSRTRTWPPPSARCTRTGQERRTSPSTGWTGPSQCGTRRAATAPTSPPRTSRSRGSARWLEQRPATTATTWWCWAPVRRG